MLSVGALGISIAAFGRQRRQEDFGLARELHSDLTTGEVARAREDLGTLVHDGSRIKDEDLPRVRTAYFTLLWCFERIYAGRCAIADRRFMRNRPLEFLDRMIRWQVGYWAENMDEARSELGRRLGVQISDESSREALAALHRDIRPAR